MATPVDFSKDNTTVSMWSKSIDNDKIVKTYGHFDGYLLDKVEILIKGLNYFYLTIYLDLFLQYLLT